MTVRQRLTSPESVGMWVSLVALVAGLVCAVFEFTTVAVVILTSSIVWNWTRDYYRKVYGE